MEKMERKYEFTGETKKVDGKILQRIRYVRDFPNLTDISGTLGGFLESDMNLSHYGNCVVLDEATVYGKARVTGDAVVRGEAMVMEDATVSGRAAVVQNAVILGRAIVSEDARVAENASVLGNAVIQGFAEISGKAKVQGSSFLAGEIKVYDEAYISMTKRPEKDEHIPHIFDTAEVFGFADIIGKATISGDARVSGHATVKNEVKISGSAVVNDMASISEKAEITGSAIITGKSVIKGSAEIKDTAVVKDTEVYGRAIIRSISHIFNSEVFDNAVVVASNLSGVRVFADAFVNNTMLNGDIVVNGDARIVDSSIRGKGITVMDKSSLKGVEILEGEKILFRDNATLTNAKLSGVKVFMMADEVQFKGDSLRKRLSIKGKAIEISGSVDIEQDVVIDGENIQLRGLAEVKGKVIISDNVKLNEMATVINSDADVFATLKDVELSMDNSLEL